MKQTVLAVVASAAIGAAAALHFSSPPPSVRSTPQLDARTLQAAMERALESVGFGSQARAAQAPWTAPPSRAGAPVAPAETERSARPAAGDVGEDREQELPPADRPAIESVRPFDEDETLRRTWLFRSERDVIAWLGTPDEVMYEGGGERWHYKRTDGKLLVAFFARGRLLNIMR